MTQPDTWYIVKQESGQCAILSASQLSAESEDTNRPKSWGPYSTIEEAIAHRVGLIRAGKCQPA